MDRDAREFPNPYESYNASKFKDIVNNGKLTKASEEALQNKLFELISKLEEKLQDYDTPDNSVYTGVAGIGLLYFHLSEVLDKANLPNAAVYCKQSLKNLNGHRVTFLCGDAGPLALSAVINHKLGRSKESRENIERLESINRYVEPKHDTPDELLYGRAGYLYALLFVQKHVKKSAISESIIKRVIENILVAGRRHSNLGRTCPLGFFWHDKHYLGAAHGYIGILFMLLQAREYVSAEDMDSLIKPTLMHVLSLQFPSGNFPSSLGSSTDKLIHWCHGAPGAIHLMALAYQVFGDRRFLEAAEKCCQVIWQRGLLKKGYGICHGVAGNGYAFLRMAQLTGDEKYLYQAYKFAEWCFDYGTRGCNEPDRPLSLFEGLAGTIYFLTDMTKPDKSAFPAFQLF